MKKCDPLVTIRVIILVGILVDACVQLLAGCAEPPSCHCQPSKTEWCTNDTHGDIVCIPTSFPTDTPGVRK